MFCSGATQRDETSRVSAPFAAVGKPFETERNAAQICWTEKEGGGRLSWATPAAARDQELSLFGRQGPFTQVVGFGAGIVAGAGGGGVTGEVSGAGAGGFGVEGAGLGVTGGAASDGVELVIGAAADGVYWPEAP